MTFSLDKQNGVVFVLPVLWVMVAIGFASVKALKSNEPPVAEVSKKVEAYKQEELLMDAELRGKSDLSLTQEE